MFGRTPSAVSIAQFQSDGESIRDGTQVMRLLARQQASRNACTMIGLAMILLLSASFELATKTLGLNDLVR